MIVEHFNYKEAKQKTNRVLSYIIPFLILVYIVTICMLYRLNRTGPKWLFWLIIIMLLTPIFLTQACLPILIIFFLLLSRAAADAKIKPLYPSMRFHQILSVITVFYLLTSYVIVTFIIFFFCRMTSFDFQHEEIHTLPFIDAKHINIPIADKKTFQDSIDRGRDHVQSKRIVFGCIGRNIAPNLPNEKIRIETIGGLFQDYRVVIFENDSKDGTRAMLEEWEKENPHVEILKCCDDGDCGCRLNIKDLYSIGKDSVSTERIEKMRTFRQKVLDHVQSNYSEYDYLMIKDMDLSGGMYLDGLLTCFSRDDWDVVFSRGFTTAPILSQYFLYDPLAFIDIDEEYDAHIENHLCFMLRHQILILDKYLKNIPLDSPWRRCRSGFNGNAIYRMSSIRDACYPSGFRCEHIALHYNMAQKKYDRVYFNPAMVLFVGQQGPSNQLP